MEFVFIYEAFVSMSVVAVSLYLLFRLIISFWILPHKVHMNLKSNGFGGPTPYFPLGNIEEMSKISKSHASSSSSSSSGSLISNDIHSTVFPYFAQWQESHGKVFIYWLGTEPFLYIADPEFLKQMSSCVKGRNWGKPNVFRNDRKPMFGDGLVMVEGDDWVRHRHIITTVLSPANLKAMTSLMVESTNNMIDKWGDLINSGYEEIDVEKEITATAAEIIAKTTFGTGYENGKQVFERLKAMQMALFKNNRYVGVPFSKLLSYKQTVEAKNLGKEVDYLISSIMAERRKSNGNENNQNDLLGLLLEENGRLGKTLTARELVDECKTFFFGGHETTALALSWTLLLLAVHPEWQDQLREEIRQVTKDQEIELAVLSRLKKMEWVMSEVLRLYPPAPNVQRQAREDIKVDKITIPKGTNMWIDLVGMHHDPNLWGDDLMEFKPNTFENDSLYGGCKHKMVFLPFGFGGRTCIGKNLSIMEYKVVLTLILTSFSLSLSPSYSHSPCIMLSLRPSFGFPLILRSI